MDSYDQTATGADGDADPARVGRRFIFRGGAVIAAGGIAAVAGRTEAATAATGDAVKVGDNLTATSSTSITIDSSRANPIYDPPLKLANDWGVQLELQTLTPDRQLEVHLGAVASTEWGPLTAVRNPYNGLSEGTYLATEWDLLSMPRPVPTGPSRRTDTRNITTSHYAASSPDAFDSAGRLRAGAWMDILIQPPAPPRIRTGVNLHAAHVNLTVTGSLGTGYLTVYPIGDRPPSSSLNFAKGQTICNSAFVGVTRSGNGWGVRIYTSATTHVILDQTGVVADFGYPTEGGLPDGRPHHLARDAYPWVD